MCSIEYATIRPRPASHRVASGRAYLRLGVATRCFVVPSTSSSPFGKAATQSPSTEVTDTVRCVPAWFPHLVSDPRVCRSPSARLPDAVVVPATDELQPHCALRAMPRHGAPTVRTPALHAALRVTGDGEDRMLR